MQPSPAAQLPPESRFALHAVAAGASVEEVGELTKLPTERVETQLRTAARALVGAAPPPSAGRAALLERLQPAVEAVQAWQAACDEAVPGVDPRLSAWVRGGLDGPLLLATLEWAGDHPERLRRALELYRSPELAVEVRPVPPARRGCLGGAAVLLVGALAALASIVSS